MPMHFRIKYNVVDTFTFELLDDPFTTWVFLAEICEIKLFPLK